MEKLINPYGRSKYMDELIAESYALQYPEMKIIGTRAFHAYGIGEIKKGDKDSRVHKFINMKLWRANDNILGRHTDK